MTLIGILKQHEQAGCSNPRRTLELGVQDPNIWIFIEGLGKAQKHRDFDYKSMIAGQVPALKRRHHLDVDERNFNLLNQYNGNTTLHRQSMWKFLRGIAKNFYVM